MPSVLVIEDHPGSLDLMVYLLEHAGCLVHTARDGITGIAAARRHRPTLIVCDLDLPHCDGHGVARTLKDDPALAGVPLVAVTAAARSGDRDAALAAGFDGYFAKPIDPATFVADVTAIRARER
ncbi:MAG: response regulator [Gammaproteobacteria bacterium]